jgi:hypothetical protein
MGLIDFFRRNRFMFYEDSIEVLIGIKKTLGECVATLSAPSLDNYRDKLGASRNAFLTANGIIDDFIRNWVTDDDKICSTLHSAKDYINYYIRLCSNSSDLNFKGNIAYMLDSIETVSLVLNSKISYISKEKLTK